MRFYTNDTIAAVSTAVGEGAIGIVRLSGADAVAIAEKIIKRSNGTQLQNQRSHSLFLARVIDPKDGSQVDEALVSIMRAPSTYTREDVVEINCHGGIVALRKTLALVLAAGARAAEPGEFTKRAFLNGRIDLAQAEAVLDTIKSKTDTALKAAVSQLEGGLSKSARAIAEIIANVLTQVEAAVDFSDEDIETLPADELLATLAKAQDRLEELLRTSVRGKMLKEGVRVAIMGKPNVGKSSLLNALLRKERAIVTPVPGTTRDVIEETINIKGIPLVLKDTAGIRESSDEVERIGIKYTRQAIKTSDIILCVIDGSQKISNEDRSLINEILDEKAILVVNKIDLPQAVSAKDLNTPANFKARVDVSAVSGDGIQRLEDKIEEILFEGQVGNSGAAIITNARHEQLLEKAVKHIAEAALLINNEQPEEVVSMVLKDALDNLAEITGEAIGEDVLDRIFSQFCIGK